MELKKEVENLKVEIEKIKNRMPELRKRKPGRQVTPEAFLLRALPFYLLLRLNERPQPAINVLFGVIAYLASIFTYGVLKNW